jgi:hypothetical protein
MSIFILHHEKMVASHKLSCIVSRGAIVSGRLMTGRHVSQRCLAAVKGKLHSRRLTRHFIGSLEKFPSRTDGITNAESVSASCSRARIRNHFQMQSNQAAAGNGEIALWLHAGCLRCAVPDPGLFGGYKQLLTKGSPMTKMIPLS